MARGCPVHRQARAKGSPAEFDTAAVIRWRADELSGPAGPALERERARLAAAQAGLAEMKLAAARGELLPADKVSLAVTSAFARVRTRLLAIPPKAAPRLVGKGRPAEIQALLTDYVEEALRELSETRVIGESSDGLAYDADDPT